MVGVEKELLNTSDNHNSLLSFNNSGIPTVLGSYPVGITIFLYNGYMRELYA